MIVVRLLIYDFPCSSAVIAADDRSVTANCPALFRRRKGNPKDVIFSEAAAPFPCLSAVGSLSQSAEFSRNDASFTISNCNQSVFLIDDLPIPAFAGVIRIEHQRRRIFTGARVPTQRQRPAMISIVKGY